VEEGAEGTVGMQPSAKAEGKSVGQGGVSCWKQAVFRGAARQRSRASSNVRAPKTLRDISINENRSGLQRVLSRERRRREPPKVSGPLAAPRPSADFRGRRAHNALRQRRGG